jgi:hypothetical protein
VTKRYCSSLRIARALQWKSKMYKLNCIYMFLSLTFCINFFMFCVYRNQFTPSYRLNHEGRNKCIHNIWLPTLWEKMSCGEEEFVWVWKLCWRRNVWLVWTVTGQVGVCVNNRQFLIQLNNCKLLIGKFKWIRCSRNALTLFRHHRIPLPYNAS